MVKKKIPKKFGSLANTKLEPWKLPLPEFIEELYIKHSYNDFFQGRAETFSVTRFLLEMTQHIPPRGLQYIRRYGLYAPRRRTARTKGKWPDMPHVMRLAPAG